MLLVRCHTVSEGPCWDWRPEPEGWGRLPVSAIMMLNICRGSRQLSSQVRKQAQRGRRLWKSHGGFEAEMGYVPWSVSRVATQRPPRRLPQRCHGRSGVVEGSTGLEPLFSARCRPRSEGRGAGEPLCPHAAPEPASSGKGARYGVNDPSPGHRDAPEAIQGLLGQGPSLGKGKATRQKVRKVDGLS